MSWLKLDDQIFYNRKVAQCDANAKLLYIVGLTYCAHQLTDGFIPSGTLPLLAGMAGLEWQIAKQSSSKLLEICLWVARDDGWQIPDYLDYNPSREQVLHNKSVRSETGKLGGQAKAKQIAKQIAKQNPGEILPPSPSPSPSEERGVARPPASKPVPAFPEHDPEWGAAISKLECVGPMTGNVLLELLALWPDLVNGKRAWLDDAITLAQANGASSPAYAVRVLTNSVRSGKRPGEVIAPAPRRRSGGVTSRDLDEILGVDIHGNPINH